MVKCGKSGKNWQDNVNMKPGNGEVKVKPGKSEVKVKPGNNEVKVKPGNDRTFIFISSNAPSGCRGFSVLVFLNRSLDLREGVLVVSIRERGQYCGA